MDDSSGTPSSPNKTSRRVVEPIAMLDGAESVHLSIEILRESYDEILEVLRQNELDHEEGLRTVLLNGLGYMDASIRLGRINDASRADGKEKDELVQGLVQDLATYHSMYSVLKFKTFKLYKLAQKLEFNVAGLRASDKLWEEWADRMRQEQAQMQAELIRLRALMSEFKADMDYVPSPLLPPEAPEQSSGETDEETNKPQALDDSSTTTVSLWMRIRRLLGPS